MFIPNLFLKMQFQITNETILLPFFEYFEYTWICRIGRNQKRRNPKFHVQMWNFYDLLEKIYLGLIAHNSISSISNAHHPSIWTFIYALQKEVKLDRMKIHQ